MVNVLGGFGGLMSRLTDAKAGSVDELVVPRLRALAVEGEGSPGDEAFRDAVRELYALAFAVKMLPRTGRAPTNHVEYEMPPMEGVFDSLGRQGRWTIRFAQPEFVTHEIVERARAGLGERGRAPEAVLLRDFDEGLCVQTLHVGPFADEARSVRLLADFARSRGYLLADHHHEIYLDDPQKVEPAQQRTVLRYPVRHRQTRIT